MKFGRIVLQVNAHRLTESDFDTLKNQDGGMTLFYTEKCCRLVSAHEASARCICSSVRQFLIHDNYIFILDCLQGCVKVWDIRDQSPKTPVSQLDCLVRTLHIHL